MGLSIVKIRVEHEPDMSEIEKREAFWLHMVEDGQAEVEWFDIGNGEEFCSALKLPLGCGGKMVRIAVRYHTAVAMLAALDAKLPTKEQADRMFKHPETKHIAPVVSRPTHNGSPTSASTTSMFAVSEQIDRLALKYRGEDGKGPLPQLDNDGKLWIRGAADHMCINYGLVDIPSRRHPNVPPMRSNGLHMWQDIGRAHDLPGKAQDNHVDGTQYVRGVRNAKDTEDTIGSTLFDVPRSYYGERGMVVYSWQKHLQEGAEATGDMRLHPGKADGIHGPKTEVATKHFLSGEWQDYEDDPDVIIVDTVDVSSKPPPSGDVPDIYDPNTTEVWGVEWPATSFKQSVSYYPARKGVGAPRKVVVHVAQLAEVMNAAESLQAWTGREAPVSWGCAVDKDSIAGSVRDEHTAWACPGANHDGLQIELAGYAEQTKKEWGDDYSIGTLDNAAKVVAFWCVRWDIPITKLSAVDLSSNPDVAGIMGHYDATVAGNQKGGERFKRNTHTDPGAKFPWYDFMQQVKHYAEVMRANR